MSDYLECGECGTNKFMAEWDRVECENGHGVTGNILPPYRRPEFLRRYPKGSVVPEWNHYCADGHEPVASMGDRCPVCRRDADGKVSEPPRREAEQRVIEAGYRLASWAVSVKLRPGSNTPEFIAELLARTQAFALAHDDLAALPSPAEAGEKVALPPFPICDKCGICSHCGYDADAHLRPCNNCGDDGHAGWECVLSPAAPSDAKAGER
jgi:hypothetical protein